MANHDTEDRYRTLGLFSLMILAHIRRHPDHAYGAHINDALSTLFNRDGTSPQVSIALRRLEESGYIKRVEGSSAEPWGKSRKYYGLTMRGNHILDMVKDMVS